MAEEWIGTIEHYYPKAQAAVLRVDRGEVRVGDQIRIVGHGVDLTEEVTSLQMDHRPIEEAHAGERVGLGVPQRVHEKDSVYLVHA